MEVSSLKNKKIVFFGTPDFTVEFLDLFKSLSLQIVAVVTGEDKPFGRGLQIKSPGPKVWAEKFAEHLQIFQPKKLDDQVFSELQKLDADLFIVIAYGKIIPERFINMPKFGTINLHYSLLPKYRGASPVESAILNNEKETGLTIQRMVYELDAGNILYKEETEIQETETTYELRSRLNKMALEIFPTFLENLFTGKIVEEVQDPALATKCGKFTKEDYNVTNELKDTNKIFLKYKAFDKRIYFFHNYKDSLIRVKITDMNKSGILKLLPESRKEITLTDFENSFGKIYV